LNTLAYNSLGIAAPVGNQFTLDAGTYEIRWSAPAGDVGGNQSWLYNVTDGLIVKRGTSERVVGTVSAWTRSFGSAVVTLTGSTVFEIRHRSTGTKATNGLGIAAGLGVEVYTRVEISAFSLTGTALEVKDEGAVVSAVSSGLNFVGTGVTVTGGPLTPTVTIPGTDLAYTAATRLLESSTGTDVTLPLVTTGDAGLAPASGGGTTNFLRADGTWAAPGGGGGSLSGTSSITVPSGAFDDTETIAAVGVLPGDVVFVTLAPHDDTDENDPELLDLWSLSGVAGTDQITVKAVFASPTSGVVKVNWMAV